MADHSSLSGLTVVVTGSTSGIGLGIAESYARVGSNLVLHGSRSTERAAPVIDKLRKEFPKVQIEYVQADLSQGIEECQKVIEFAIKKFGNIHVLVNNAGIQHVSNLENFPVEKWNKLIAVNLTAPFLLMKLAVPHMKKNKDTWGRIIQISSVHGIVASVHKTAYVASKHGLNGLSKVVALELAKDTNITVNSVCPGYVRTPLVEKQIDALGEEKHLNKEDAVKALVSEKQPLQKFSTCRGVGDYCVFLSTRSADTITGANQVIDGAWTVG